MTGLSQGKHLVEYRYRNGAFSLGWKISLLCAAVFGLMVFKTRPAMPVNRKGKFER